MKANEHNHNHKTCCDPSHNHVSNKQESCNDPTHNHHEEHNHDEDLCCDSENDEDHDHGKESCCEATHSHKEHEHKEEFCCESNHDHDDHVGCACESGILENIEVESKQSKKPFIILGIGAILFGLGLYVSSLESIGANIISGELLGQIFFLITVIFVGHGIIKHGLKSLLKKEVKIDFLITIAAIGTFILGEGAEGAALILLFYLAEYLEHYALDRSKRSIVNLVKLTPDIGIIKKDGKEIEVKVDEIEIGDVVVVKPGDKIPIDGKIINGHTSVNQSSITGESIPVNKEIGDEVYASTINEEGYIELKVTKNSKDSVFSKIISLIKESEEKKAKIDIFIDRFAAVYTPIVIVLAILVAILPTLLFGASLTEWTYRALVLLVISCPCALAISTPVSMVSAITAGTKNGIIIKGGEYIEELSKVKAILFDKTGTLTEGNLEISNITPRENHTKDEIIEIACSIEAKSKHPIAKTFNEYHNKNNISLKEVSNFNSIAGKGLVGEIEGKKYYIGKESLFNGNLENDNLLESKTNVIVGEENNIYGFISLTDKIRDDSKETINKLKSANIDTMMLTGDNEKIASEVSNKIGLSNYYADLLPEDKVNIVQSLVDKYEDVAMVGDGVNDTPSLARANVGIAMGLGGADVAVETADIVLLEDKLSKLAYLIDLSKKTLGVIKQNVVVCLLVKGLLAVLGIIGLISLWEAVLIGDMGLTLLVVANALRISK
ncbi:cadmium-translocating P-type ATPase [Methanobrevibacter sp. OttesenSCG-928-K11]|nr:cadmium-translocating P-type ATPase [Methanobrevibacter sp. OttesenSCG-928-K11]MDL2271138.1 cadmium-translocating P-type ATPase [Methanobrevibacter sp. OttesenSCG-928-I08]